VAAVGRQQRGDGVVRQSLLQCGDRAGHRSRRRLHRQRRSLRRHRPARQRPSAEALATFPALANLQGLYHNLPNGFSETPKNGFQPRLGFAYAVNERTTLRAGVGRF